MYTSIKLQTSETNQYKQSKQSSGKKNTYLKALLNTGNTSNAAHSSENIFKR